MIPVQSFEIKRSITKNGGKMVYNNKYKIC